MARWSDEDDEWIDGPEEEYEHFPWLTDADLEDEYFGWSRPPTSWSSRMSNPRKFKRGKRYMANKLGSLLDLSHGTVLDTSASYQIFTKFVAETEVDIFFARVEITVRKSSHTLAQITSKIKSLLTEARAVMPASENAIIIQGQRGTSPVLIWVNTNMRRRQASQEVYDLNIEILATPDASVEMKKLITETFSDEKMAMIKWWTAASHGEGSRDIYLPPSKTKLLPEFYPDLGDPSKYLSEFMAAEEAVLMIAGPPGTGKTTLLRHLVTDYKLSAHVIYDEKLMEKDGIFQSFLFDEDGDIMIIEDADTILTSRERDGNKLMSRFLNVSDGLIKLPNKKLVFTTNIIDFGNVDNALLRPGRCFGVMHTRALNLSEAQTAAKVAGLPIPTEKREYTLAELFNQGKRAQVRTMGFGARHA